MLKRRPRTLVEIGDLVREPDETMLTLISMKNDGRSWQMIADSISTEYTKVSDALVRKVALGLCKSPKIEMALGLRDEVVTVAMPIARYKRTYKKRTAPARKRHRLIIECTDNPELITRFHTQRGDKTPAEHQEDLMDLWDGVGEVV